MPIVKFHLADKDISDGQIESVIEQATQIYAEVLDSPVDRIRVFVDLHAPNLIGVGGKLVSKGGKNAPFFEFIVMKGRSLEQRQAIAEQFTNILAVTLKVDKGISAATAIPLNQRTGASPVVWHLKSAKPKSRPERKLALKQ